ncbi:MAG: hypothetical protein RLZZ383_2360 [Pseudomonadota bacterium]|jgi:hypothetical protein
MLWLIAALSSAFAYPIVNEPLPEGFDRVAIDVGGFVQPRFRWQPDDPTQGSLGEVGFSVQRMRVQLNTQLLPKADARWGLGVQQVTSFELMPEARLEDGFLNLSVGTEFQLQVGQFKAPLHRAILAGDQSNLFADRNQITRWVPEREIGAMFHGWTKKRVFEYEAAVFNGEGKNRLANVNKKVMAVGRVVVSPLGSPGAGNEILLDWRPPGEERFRPIVSVGSSVFYNVDGEPGQQEAYVGVNGEFFLHYRPLTVMAEAFYRTSDYENPALSDYKQLGGYAQFGYFLYGVPWASRHIALMGRFEQGDRYIPALDVPPSGPLDPGVSNRRVSAGIGIYANQPLFKAIQDLRLVASYTYKDELEAGDVKNDEFNLAASLSF